MNHITVPKAKRATLNVGDPLAEVIGDSGRVPFGLRSVRKQPHSCSDDNKDAQAVSLPTESEVWWRDERDLDLVKVRKR